MKVKDLKGKLDDLPVSKDIHVWNGFVQDYQLIGDVKTAVLFRQAH